MRFVVIDFNLLLEEYTMEDGHAYYGLVNDIFEISPIGLSKIKVVKNDDWGEILNPMVTSCMFSLCDRLLKEYSYSFIDNVLDYFLKKHRSRPAFCYDLICHGQYIAHVVLNFKKILYPTNKDHDERGELNGSFGANKNAVNAAVNKAHMQFQERFYDKVPRDYVERYFIHNLVC